MEREAGSLWSTAAVPSSLGYSPRRSRASRKPQVTCPDARIFRCTQCGLIMNELGAGCDTGLICCGKTMQLLEATSAEVAAQNGIKLHYDVKGGLNDSTVEVTWVLQDAEERLQWMMLKTFTGFYVRYPVAGKKPPMRFPLADEDAYVYCDRPVCLKCLFRCKLGCVIYAYFSKSGLVERPLDQMTKYFKTSSVPPADPMES